MIDAAIHTEDLSRHFGPLKAVDGLSLRVPAGTVFGFLGPNGSGKTTTIRLLLGLLEPTSGRAGVLGLDTRRQAGQIRALCGALLEAPGLYGRLSAHENLEFYGRVARLAPGERAARIEALLTHLGLWERRHERVADWSRGMRQKLAVARALLHRPPLVFLDEPTAGLDPLAAAALRDDLAALAAGEGVTVFLTTHNLAEAERLCSQIGVIRAGRLLAVGRPDELRAGSGGPRLAITGSGFDAALLAQLRARPEVLSVVARPESAPRRLVIELRAGAGSAPLVGLLVAGGAEIEEVRRESASLEEVFMTLVKEEAE